MNELWYETIEEWSNGEALEYAGLPNTENNRYNVSHIIRGHMLKHVFSQFNFNIFLRGLQA